MCDFSEKLIVWLDRELPEDEAADVERHVRACTECRSHVDAYEQVSSTFDAYCDLAMASKVRRNLPRWVPVVCSGAVAAAVALLLILPRARVDKLPVHPPAAAAPPPIVLDRAPSPSRRVHRRHAVTPVRSQNASWLPPEPAIQIAIPAEAMFPPGAMPEGVNFIADLSIATDGSAQRLRLRPRLIGFERRPAQP